MPPRTSILHAYLRAVVKLHFHATGDSPLSESSYDHHVDVLVGLLEAANDQKHLLTPRGEETYDQ